MARPAKNNCDYFPHDAGMRNHKKVKAVRSKFGIMGYAVWSMLIEYLTGNDGNVFEYSDLEFELMSGDFGVSATEIRGVVDYCISLELLFNKNGFINSESLDERLAPVYIKRGVAKEQSAKQRRISGKFVTNNAEPNGVSVTEMPQSKVNKSKEEESKVKKTREQVAVPFLNGCLVAWNDWVEHRKQMRKPLTQKAIEKQIKFLGGRPEPEIIEILNTAIEKNWQGLWPLNKSNNGTKISTTGTIRTTDAIIEQGKDFGIERGF